MPFVLAVVLKVVHRLTRLRRVAAQVPDRLPIGMAVSAFEQRLIAEREMSEGDRRAHQFVEWLMEEGGYGLDEGVAYCEGQDDVWDWDGNNDN